VGYCFPIQMVCWFFCRFFFRHPPQKNNHPPQFRVGANLFFFVLYTPPPYFLRVWVACLLGVFLKVWGANFWIFFLIIIFGQHTVFLLVFPSFILFPHKQKKTPHPSWVFPTLPLVAQDFWGGGIPTPNPMGIPPTNTAVKQKKTPLQQHKKFPC